MVIVGLLAGGLIGFWWGRSRGFKEGYEIAREIHKPKYPKEHYELFNQGGVAK